MNKKNSIKRLFRNMKYKSRKNKRMIGGENCSKYITDHECRADVECTWKMKQRVCESKVKQKVQIQKTQQQYEQADNEQHQMEKTEEHQMEKKEEQPDQQEQTHAQSNQKFQFLHGKRPISSQNFPAVYGRAQPNASIGQVYTSLKAKPDRAITPASDKPIRKISLVPPRLVPAPSRLDNLELVSPLVSYNVNWPLITDVVNVPGDGHCLFHALRAGLRSLGLFNGSTIELRTFIVTQLRELLQNGENLDVIWSRTAEYGRAEDNLTFGAYFETQHATDPIRDAKDRVKNQINTIAKAKEEYELAQAIAMSVTPDVDPPAIKSKIQRPVLNPLTRTLNLKRVILEKAEKELIRYQAATETAVTIPLNQQVRAHLDGMLTNAWGTEIEIWMASRLFQVNIDVYTLPRDPITDAPLKNGKSAVSGQQGQYIPLIPLNRRGDPQRPTIRLFNGSGATPKGIHYQVIPASISLNEFQHQPQ